MERFARICFTWILACVVGAAGTLWVNAVTNKNEQSDNEGKMNDFSLNAQAAALIDADTGRLLWGKNADTPLAMASTTKIMTCLVALENVKMDAVVEISEYAASMPDVQLNAVAGDTFYLKDLLYALMLESDNDVAVAVAEYVGGSEEAFASMMNERAKKIGCQNTHFVTANGLDAESHYTTAADLGKIAAEAIQNETLVDIINTPAYSFSNVEGSRYYQVNNKNSFLNMMEGAFGVKTGYTNDAGYCFVGALKRDGRTYISTVLGSGWPPNKNYKWQDTIKLMNYGLENYTLKTIGMNQFDVGTLEVTNGIDTKVALNVDCQTRKILLSETDKVSVKLVKALEVQAPVDKNEVVGWLYYQVNDTLVEKFPIYTVESVGRKTLSDCFEKMLWRWFCF